MSLYSIYYLSKTGEKMDFSVGQVIRLKKSHPCGGNAWEIQRIGMDFSLQCLSCGHSVMVPRRTIEKSFRGFID